MPQKNFQTACKTFCDQQKADPTVIGIIVSGSYAYGRLDKNSDIDIHIILSPTCTHRERGNTWINGVEIEYFKNPPQQIRSYFQKEKNSPHTADMLANGQLIYHNSEVVIALIEEAKKLLATPPDLPKKVQIELAKYHFDDLFKDLEDSQLNGDEIAVALLENQIINLAIDWFCKMHQIRRTKHKRIVNQLSKVDPDFAKLIQMAISKHGQAVEAMPLLERKIGVLLGGMRTREWVLKSELDL